MQARATDPKYAIGQQYKSSGKYPRLCTVVDILRTYNYRNELVKVRYESLHEFSGQMVTDYDVLEVTIAKGIVR